MKGGGANSLFGGIQRIIALYFGSTRAMIINNKLKRYLKAYRKNNQYLISSFDDFFVLYALPRYTGFQSRIDLDGDDLL